MNKLNTLIKCAKKNAKQNKKVFNNLSNIKFIMKIGARMKAKY